MPELSADAKKELAEAIRIVKEDKQYNMLREIHSRGNAPINPTTPPDPTNPVPPPVVPPDPNAPPPNPPKKDAYWGELLS